MPLTMCHSCNRKPASNLYIIPFTDAGLFGQTIWCKKKWKMTLCESLYYAFHWCRLIWSKQYDAKKKWKMTLCEFAAAGLFGQNNVMIKVDIDMLVFIWLVLSKSFSMNTNMSGLRGYFAKYFKFVHSYTLNFIYLSLYGYSFKGCYFGAIMRSTKRAKIKTCKNTSYTVLIIEQVKQQ